MIYIWRLIQAPLLLLLFVIVLGILDEFDSSPKFPTGIFLIAVIIGLGLCVIESRIHDLKQTKTDISTYLKRNSLEAHRTFTFILIITFAAFAFTVGSVSMILDGNYLGILGIILGIFCITSIFNHLLTINKPYIKITYDGIESKIFGLIPWGGITRTWLSTFTGRYNTKNHTLHIYIENISDYEQKLSFFQKTFFRFLDKKDNALRIPLNFLTVDANIIHEYCKKTFEQYRLKNDLPALTGNPKYDDILKALHNNTKDLKKIDISNPNSAEELDAIFERQKNLQNLAIEQVKQISNETKDLRKKLNRSMIIFFVLLLLAFLIKLLFFY